MSISTNLISYAAAATASSADISSTLSVAATTHAGDSAATALVALSRDHTVSVPNNGDRFNRMVALLSQRSSSDSEIAQFNKTFQEYARENENSFAAQTRRIDELQKALSAEQSQRKISGETSLALLQANTQLNTELQADLKVTKETSQNELKAMQDKVSTLQSQLTTVQTQLNLLLQRFNAHRHVMGATPRNPSGITGTPTT